MKKEDKDTLLVELTELVKSYTHFYIVDLQGLNAEQTSNLRRKCFEKEVKLVVVKNTIFEKALEGLDAEAYNGLNAALKGSSAIMFSNTANVPGKLIQEFAAGKEVPALKGAFVEGAVYVGANHLATLAAFKSKNELIADIIALLQSPIKTVIGGLQNKADKEAESTEAPAAE